MGVQMEQEVSLPRRNILKTAVMIGSTVALETLTGCGVVLEKTTETPKYRGEFGVTPRWEQDFSRLSDGPIDTKVWTFETNPEVPGYNNEKQAYTRNQKNARIQDGKLVIEAHREPYVYPTDPGHHYEITSGRLDTRGSLAFEYGKIEAELKLPEGKGVWPAFWLLSTNEPYTQGIPDETWQRDKRTYMRNGELDIMEFYGKRPNEIEATIHTYARSQEGHVTVPDATTSFHTYGIEVTPKGITWTLDSKPYYQVMKPSDNPEQWPFGRGNKLHAIVNLAMGGTGGGAIDPHHDTWRMEAKSVRFYELDSN